MIAEAPVTLSPVLCTVRPTLSAGHVAGTLQLLLAMRRDARNQKVEFSQRPRGAGVEGCSAARQPDGAG